MLHSAKAPLSQLINDLDSPLEEVRLAALRELESTSSLVTLRAVRRVAATDPSVTLRSEAQRFIARAASMLLETTDPGGSGRADGPSDRAAPSADELTRRLQDPDPVERVNGVRALSVSSAPRAPEILSTALTSETDPFVVCALLQALAAIGGAASAGPITSQLSAQDPRVRATAVEALEAIGDASLLPQLIRLLDDPHHRVRAATVRAVLVQDKAAVLACVDRMLGDPNEMAVRSAFYVLRFFDEATAIPRLREGLADARPGVRQMALGSLRFAARRGSVRAAQLAAWVRDGGNDEVLARREPALVSTPSGSGAGDQQGLEPRFVAMTLNDETSGLLDEVEDRLRSPVCETRIRAIRETVRIGRDDLLPTLCDGLARETDAWVKATLVAAIGRLGSVADVAVIAPFLAAMDPRLRANAVEAIGLLARGGETARLVPLLSDDSNRVRANAIVALSSNPQVDVLPALLEMAASSRPGFAKSAIWAAATVATPATVRVLATLADSDDDDLRHRARHALTALAPVMREAVDALRGRQRKTRSTRRLPVMPDARFQRLVFDLRNDLADVRMAALREIASLGDSRLLTAVREVIKDPDPMVRRCAREAVRTVLRGSTPTVGDRGELDRFDRELGSGRERAAPALESVVEICLKAGPRAVAGVLAGRLASTEDPELKSSLLLAMALVGDSDVVALIGESTRDTDGRVRASAVSALELVASPEQLGTAVACLADPDPQVRSAAVSASLSIYREPFLNNLKGLLHSRDVAERAVGLQALNAVSIPERYDRLVDHLLAETDPRVWAGAVELLARELVTDHTHDRAGLLAQLPADKRQALEAGVDALTRDLPRTTPPTPAGAIAGPADRDPLSVESLQELARAGALTPEVIRSGLSNRDDPAAVTALLEHAAAMALPDMMELTRPFIASKDRRLRLAAVQALERLQQPAAVEPLATLVKDRDREVSSLALAGLARRDRDVAQGCVRSLLEAGQPWAIKRGMELAETLGDPACLQLVLRFLELGIQPGVVEIVTRLVMARGDRSTLEALAALYRRAPVRDRPFILDLGTALAVRLGLSAEDAISRFPSEPSAGPAAPPSPGPAAPGPAGGSWLPLLVGGLVVLTLAVAALVLACGP